jgi:hypothetical protein
MATSTYRPALWTSGDWNAFFGFGTNILVNMLTFFGFMHGESVGIAITPTVAVAYAIVACFLYSLVRYPEFIASEISPPREALSAHPAE